MQEDVSKNVDNITFLTRKMVKKQAQSLLTGEEINRLWFICTMEYYTIVKINEPQLHITTYMNLRSMVLSEKKHISSGFI